MPAKLPAKRPAKPVKARKPAAKKAAPKPAAAKHKVAAKPAPRPKAAPPAKAAASKPAPKPGPKAVAKPVAAKPAAVAKPTPAPKKVAVKPTPKSTTKPAAASSGRGASEPRAEVLPWTATTRTATSQAAAESGARPIAPMGQSRPGATTADAEEEGYEPSTSLSLLAGPRNVKPYLAKKGEQYMGGEQLSHFRKILETWKRDLMEEVDRTVTHMKDEAANPPDPNDRATLESEFSLELRTRDRERKLIRKIDEALKRIEDGSYGYCLETGEEIGIKRLEARPVATLSIEAQERRERREKQYGDRDDRYR
jgi:DnaK suppressor protein